MTRDDVLSYLATRTGPDGAPVEVGEDHPTTEAARWGAELLALHGLAVPVEWLALVTACARGPVWARTATGAPALDGTYYALRVRELALAEPPSRACLEWVLEQVLDGDRVVAPDLIELYYAVRAARLCGWLPDAGTRAGLRAFITACVRRSPS